jgi:hypothetical protein
MIHWSLRLSRNHGSLQKSNHQSCLEPSQVNSILTMRWLNHQQKNQDENHQRRSSKTISGLPATTNIQWIWRMRRTTLDLVLAVNLNDPMKKMRTMWAEAVWIKNRLKNNVINNSLLRVHHKISIKDWRDW